MANDFSVFLERKMGLNACLQIKTYLFLNKTEPTKAIDPVTITVLFFSPVIPD